MKNTKNPILIMNKTQTAVTNVLIKQTQFDNKLDVSYAKRRVYMFIL